MKVLKLGFLAALTAFTLAAPVASQNIAEPITVGDERLFGIRAVPGFDITGKFLYEHKGEPSVTLNADGTGSFALHGRAPQPITWWVEANADGTPKMNKGPGGQIHRIIYRDNAGKFDMLDLGISYGSREMIILGERFKKY